MVYRTSAGGSFSPRLLPPHHWQEGVWGLGLFCGALLLLSLNLGTIPLYHGSEVTLAQIAREIVAAPEGSWRWLYPAVAEDATVRMPPLWPNVVAAVYQLLGVNAWTTRLPGAVLGAFSVWGVYKVGREVFHSHPPAVLAALSYLTLSPLLMTGRWAVLETVGVVGMILTVYSVLRSRRDLRWGLAVGFGIGACFLTQGFWGLSVVMLVVLFLLWDTPRLLSSFYLWWGLGLGMLPVGGWYLAQGLQSSTRQFMTLVLAHLQPTPGPSLSFLLVVFLLPGLLLGGDSLRLAQHHCHWSWAKLVWVWSGVGLLGVLLSVTQAGVSLLPLFPPLSLAIGAQLAEIGQLPGDRAYPTRLWVGLLSLAFVTVGCMAFFAFRQPLQLTMPLILGAIALTLAITALLIAQRETHFPVLLFWGMYVAALLFVSSPHWMPTPPIAQLIKPMAAMLQVTTPSQAVIYTPLAQGEQALQFYSQRSLEQATLPQLQQQWNTQDHPYLLLDYETLQQLSPQNPQVLGRVTAYGVLITKPV
ncbi:MAG: phospholipid carrier-dependent glycosyltransferase [Kamptonema sp. SIO4C4]|nr:phospholipid carrier-dependent glycosyltransferase [Kamptonema sp. SIO4C4]